MNTSLCSELCLLLAFKGFPWNFQEWGFQVSSIGQGSWLSSKWSRPHWTHAVANTTSAPSPLHLLCNYFNDALHHYGFMSLFLMPSGWILSLELVAISEGAGRGSNGFWIQKPRHHPSPTQSLAAESFCCYIGRVNFKQFHWGHNCIYLGSFIKTKWATL